MKTKLILFIIFLGGVHLAIAQRGNVNGVIKNSSGNFLESANVRLEGTNKGGVTNKNGEFEIKNIKAGQYTLIASLMGFKTVSIKITVKANQSNTIKDIVLNQKSESLDEVTINGEKRSFITKSLSNSLRQKTEITKLPQNIQVIKEELLLDQNSTNIMEGVIRNVSGVTMREHWGHFASIFMRGFRLPTFRNGFNMSDTWGPLADDMAFVDRIEFVKGPAGFMLSAGEPGGFYNVVTKKPTAKKIAQISLMGGSFDTYRAALDLGGKLTQDGKLLFRFNTLYQTADTHRGGEDAKRYGFAPALTYKLSDRTSVTTELNFHKTESFLGSAYVFAPVSAGFGSVDRNFKTTDTNYPATDINEVSFFTNFKHDFSDNWSFEAQYANYRYEQVGNSAWVYDPDGTTGPLSAVNDNGDIYRYASIWDALSEGEFFQTYVYGKLKTGPISHNILGGFDYTNRDYYPDWTNGFFPVDRVGTPFNIFNPTYGNTPNPVFDRSRSLRERNNGAYNGFTNRSFYLQDEIGLLDDRLRVTLAGRYTNLSTTGKTKNDTKFTPRAGISYDILPDFTVYGLYDESFLAQNGNKFTGDLANPVGAPLDPVKATDIEGGLKKSFFDGRLKATLGGYFITKNDLAVGVPGQQGVFVQRGKVESKGVEFDLQGEILPGLNAVVNYANTKVIDKTTGNRVAGHAKHMTNGWFNYNFRRSSPLKGFGVSLGYQYQIDRSTWTWNANNQSNLPDYFRLDGALSWQNKSKKLRIQGNINNILNKYLYSGANFGSYLYWQSEPGINGRLSVIYNFL